MFIYVNNYKRHCLFCQSTMKGRIIRGEKSEGMLLAAKDERGLSLGGVDRAVTLGSGVG